MQLVRCIIHNQKFKLPSTEGEFISGSLHDEVVKCQSHLHENPNCNLTGDLNDK